MELKPGYKQTDIGIIPLDWEPKTIGDVVQFSGGSQPPRSTFVFAPKNGYIRLIQIRDYKSDDFATYIPELTARKRCSTSDIMIGRYGPPVFQILRGIEGAYNVALIKTFPAEAIDREFLYYFLRQDSLLYFIEALSQRSSGQTGVELPALKSYGLSLPPLPEQRAIAAALSDTDALLSSLDQLIAKKRDIKQAVMQQLLTGKQRLPGFSGAWETKRLGDVGSFSKGKGLAKESINLTGTMPAIPYTAIYTDFDEVVRYSEIRQYTNPSYEQSLVKGPVLLIASSSNMLENIGKATAYVDNLDVAVGGDIILYKSLLDVRFLAYLLSTRPHRANIRLLSQGSTIRHVYSSTFSSYKLALPPLDEQAAIAAVLSDMDAEIDALQQRRDKTRALKQGMMQELLTGRTRLV